MNITISARKTMVRDSFKERVAKKLAKLERFFDDDANASVTVINEGDRETVEVTIQAKGMYFRAEKTTDDRLDSLDAVVDLLTRQIIKNKTKLEDRLRATAFDVCNMEADERNEQPAQEYHIVRTKRFVARPMDTEEAILQMNMLGHEFFVFLNAESSEMNVVYKRMDGSYGVLEPTMG